MYKCQKQTVKKEIVKCSTHTSLAAKKKTVGRNASWTDSISKEKALIPLSKTAVNVVVKRLMHAVPAKKRVPWPTNLTVWLPKHSLKVGVAVIILTLSWIVRNGSASQKGSKIHSWTAILSHSILMQKHVTLGKSWLLHQHCWSILTW